MPDYKENNTDFIFVSIVLLLKARVVLKTKLRGYFFLI